MTENNTTMASDDVEEACKAIDDEMKKLKAVGVEVGFFEGIKYPNGLSVAENAIIQNYGSPSRGIPPRPFFDDCLKKNESKWGKKYSELIVNGMDSEQALNIIGELIKNDLRASILDGDWTPNAPSTVKKKGSSKPLVDTGTMLNSIHKQIVKK